MVVASGNGFTAQTGIVIQTEAVARLRPARQQLIKARAAQFHHVGWFTGGLVKLVEVAGCAGAWLHHRALLAQVEDGIDQGWRWGEWLDKMQLCHRQGEIVRPRVAGGADEIGGERRVEMGKGRPIGAPGGLRGQGRCAPIAPVRRQQKFGVILTIGIGHRTTRAGRDQGQ